MKTLRPKIDRYIPEIITATLILTISILIIKSVVFIYLITASAVLLILSMLALKYPAAPLYLLLILEFSERIVGEFYDLSEFKPGGLQITFTDPVYGVIFVTMVLSILREPALLGRYWSKLRGGFLLGVLFVFFIIIGYRQYGYSALAEFRFLFISLFLPFYCLSARMGTAEWIKFLRGAFWVCALVTVPLIAIAIANGAWFFSPGHRILTAQFHLWLVVSLLLLAVPGLISKKPGWKAVAWLIGGCYVFLVLSDAHRSVWLLSLSILIAIWVFDRGDFRRLRIVAGCLAVAIVPLLIFVVLEGNTTISEFIVSRSKAFFAPSEDPTANWRMNVWDAAWQVVKQNPVAGVGLGRYSEDVYLILENRPKGISLHNFYLTILLKGGIILVFFYVWYIFSLGWNFVKLHRELAKPLHVYVSLGGALLVGMLGYQIAYSVSEVLILFIGVLLALCLAGLRESNEPQEA